MSEDSQIIIPDFSSTNFGGKQGTGNDRRLDNFCPSCGAAIFEVKERAWGDNRTMPPKIYKCLCKFKPLTVNPDSKKPEYQHKKA